VAEFILFKLKFYHTNNRESYLLFCHSNHDKSFDVNEDLYDDQFEKLFYQSGIAGSAINFIHSQTESGLGNYSFTRVLEVGVVKVLKFLFLSMTLQNII